MEIDWCLAIMLLDVGVQLVPVSPASKQPEIHLHMWTGLTFLDRAVHLQVPCLRQFPLNLKGENSVVEAFDYSVWPTLNAMAHVLGMPVRFGLEKETLRGAMTCEAPCAFSCCILLFSCHLARCFYDSPVPLAGMLPYSQRWGSRMQVYVLKCCASALALALALPNSNALKAACPVVLYRMFGVRSWKQCRCMLWLLKIALQRACIAMHSYSRGYQAMEC